MGTDILAVAHRFATALDQEDYKSLAGLLADNCQYVTAKGTAVGPEAIIQSYRDGAAWAKSNIQTVRYENSVRMDNGDIVITFMDHFEHNGHQHTYSCEQVVQLKADGRVCRIVHQEIPGQREAAEAYLQKVGIRRT